MEEQDVINGAYQITRIMWIYNDKHFVFVAQKMKTRNMKAGT